MKVYILLGEQLYEGYDIVSVHATQQLAEKAERRCREDPAEYDYGFFDIVEHHVEQEED